MKSRARTDRDGGVVGSWHCSRQYQRDLRAGVPRLQDGRSATHKSTMPSLTSILAGLLLASSAEAAIVKRQNASSPPTAETLNGTYEGYYAPAYGTDNFLGIPYAQAPVGPLRFHTPLSINSSFSGVRNATVYGPECVGYGLDTESQGNYVSEDCLTLNVIRSHGSGDNLPVVVCIQFCSQWITAD